MQSGSNRFPDAASSSEKGESLHTFIANTVAPKGERGTGLKVKNKKTEIWFLTREVSADLYLTPVRPFLRLLEALGHLLLRVHSVRNVLLAGPDLWLAPGFVF
ncbi:hypothetical protein CgunFtcFv8_017186 [Champsocephalus gunnari]|uniref:Uncharacterized protein n=1 Tax=Champsocephalus gunnari TaxID=52237 RepID=A0AAN8DR26_CHAGU|nr:hypothetical protein CgunFtcFv8_017186 [Champsocephalus gunnari]